MNFAFRECAECDAKPGSPVLCEACLHNREVISQLRNQNRTLKEQLSIWKRKAGENQLVAGRWQFLFEEAMKFTNKVDDLFEYAYASMHPSEIKQTIRDALSTFTAEVSKVRKSPTEKREDPNKSV